MTTKPTYQDLEERIIALEKETILLKQTKKALKDQEEFLNTVINNIPYQIFWKNKDLDYLGCNRRFSNVVGLDDPQNIKGMTDYDFNRDKTHAESYRKWDKQIINSRKAIIDLEENYHDDDGNEGTVLTSKVPVYDDKGNCICIVGICTDITKRKQIETSLRESETRFKALHNASFGGIAIHNKGIILDCNEGLSKITGYSQVELIGMNGLLLIAERSRKTVMDNILSGYEKPYEAIGLHKNKGNYPLRIEARDIPYKGNNIRVVEFRDITEFKEAQSEREELQIQLTQAQKREAIGTLAGGIAHDFNNILSGIFGYSQLIGIHINHPEKVSEYNKRIFEGAQRASNLIGQILSFSRRVEYDRQPLELLTILKEALKLIRSTIPSNIQIKEVLKTKGVILADPTQIHQVIMNLCTNAYHAMDDDGGTITIILDEVLLSEDQIPRGKNLFPGKFLKLEVRDTGSGIDHQIKEKILDPYFTTKETGKGSGLGLAVVEGIVKKHNGFIKFDTTIGQGTVFCIHFPVIENVRNDIKDPERKEEKISKTFGRVMLVDDEYAILDTLKAILSREGYEIRTFANGESALQAFAETPVEFDLIITDMTMPKMTGDKLSREILKIRADIPIIICTGYHENFTEKEAIKLGIKKYIQKPVAGSELSKIIRELLDPIPT